MECSGYSLVSAFPVTPARPVSSLVSRYLRLKGTDTPIVQGTDCLTCLVLPLVGLPRTGQGDCDITHQFSLLTCLSLSQMDPGHNKLTLVPGFSLELFVFGEAVFA